MEPDISFGNLIKEHRRALDLTQAELARRVGCATVTLRKIEYDTLRPSVQIAERLAMALNIPLEERANFIRLARMATRDTPEPPPTPTPPPAPEEIGEEDLSGRAIRGYHLGERIGSGGYGAVYRAVQPVVEREVAIKIILPKYANHPDFIRRFEAEAQLVARLEHPHIVPLYDYWREPGAAFLVMRLLRGGNLRAQVKEGPMDLNAILKVLDQIGAALQTAHQLGVIHRDLKPANILLDEVGNAYLSDFGVAKNLTNPNIEDQTQTGVWFGSLAYTSPEQIRSEAVLPQADIYSLGVLFFEMLTGHQPFRGPTPVDYITQHLHQPLPPLANFKPELHDALDPVIRKATDKDLTRRFPDIPAMLSAIRDAITTNGLGISEWPSSFGMAQVEIDPAQIENPYKGLRAFEEADAERFFGRETLIQDLLARMAEDDEHSTGNGQGLSRFLGVVGPSGSGKSSVVKAGLVPALRRGALPGSENWFIVDFIPGKHPFEELEATLLRVAVNPPESLAGQLREDTRGLVRAVERVLPQDEAVELVLVVDQFEELFTLVEDEEARAHFLESLLVGVLDECSRLRVVITIRADFTDRPLGYVDFGDLMRERTEFVLPLTPDELEETIIKPAKGAGLVLEPGLVGRIVSEVGDQPGTLPLLQYALTELFERRDGRRLTLEAYEASGGVMGALGRRAEEVYTGLDSAGREAARQLFLRLVSVGEGASEASASPDTRRRVLRSELGALHFDHPFAPSMQKDGNMDLSVDVFSRARLLTIDRDPVTRGPTVEVAHEALLREWPRLRGWLESSRGEVRMQRLLGNAAGEWAAAGKDTGFLLRGSRLDQFEGWAQETSLALTVEERGFLEASLEERRKREIEEAARQERERALERRSRRVLRALVGVFAVAAAIAIILSIFAFNQQSIANSEARARATQGAVAEEQAAIAATNAAVAQAQRFIAEAEVRARTTQQALAEEQAALGKSRELVALADAELKDSTDPSFSLALLLARESVLTTLDSYRYVTVSAEGVLNRAIERASSLLLTLQAHSGAITTVTWSPDGSQVLTASEDGTARVWDGFSGGELISLEGHESRVNSAFWSPSGDQIITGGFDDTARIWDAHNGSEISQVEQDDEVIYASWSLDGSRLFFVINNNRSTNTTNHILIQDIQTRADDLFIEFPGNRMERAISDVNLDGTRIVTLPYSRNGQVWDAQSGALLVELSREGDLLGVPISTDWHPAGTFIAAVMGHYTVGVWNGITGDVVAQLRPEETPNAVAWSPDGSLLAIGGSKGFIFLWDFQTGEIIGQIRGPFSLVTALAWNPDGTRLAAGFTNGELWVWDLEPKGMVTNLTHNWPVNMASWSPDGSLVATTGGSDFKAHIWDPQTGMKLHELQGHFSLVWSVAWNSDGSRLATTGGDGSIRIWGPESGNELSVLMGSPVDLYKTAWSPDNTQIASAGGDGIIRIWDVQSGTELSQIRGHTNDVFSVDWSHDGSRVASAS